MRKYIVFMFLMIAASLNAQIRTTVTEKFNVSKYTYISDIAHSFAFGDSVTIYAYKKKSDKYYFLIDAGDYADIISCKDIPFDAVEKQLKKLPNALADEARVLKQKLQNDVENRKREARKKEAFDGKIWATVSANYLFTPISGTDYKLKNGDVVYVVGYKAAGRDYQYAFYSTTFAGVYKTSSNRLLFSKEIDVTYLPSVDDPDVQKFLSEKQQEIIQKEAEAKVLYRSKALAGEIKGILTYDLTPVDDASKYEKGDTVCVVGYTRRDNKNYYALFSDYNAGTFQSTSSTPDFIFKNGSEIYFNRLPEIDDPEVNLLLKQKREIADSLWKIRVTESRKKLEESQLKLIQTYKENRPFVITDISWSSNSVGGIEVSLSITNCSDQTIKYVTFQGYFKNAVGDRCRNEIGGGTTWKGRGVGPIGPCPTTLDNCSERLYNCEASYDFDNLTFYSRIADTFHLSTVTVEYTNGRTVSLSGANLDKHVRY